MTTITIANRPIGPSHPCFVVAELSGNHGGSFDRAKALIEAAAKAGASAAKVQCFVPSDMTMDTDADTHRINWDGEDTTLYRLYQRTAMPLEWHPLLKDLTESYGLVYFASVFSKAGIEFGENIGLPAYKIASFELTDLPLIQVAARTGKPVILSTGMATRSDVREAVSAADGALVGKPWANCAETGITAPIALLKCTSAYPAPLRESNLHSLGGLDSWRECVIGLSDHTRSNSVVSAAVALGACIVERHLTLSRAAGGPDATFSDEPDEFAAMVRCVRDVEAAMGSVHYGPTESERAMLHFRRSLWVVADVSEGEVFTTENVRSLRPSGGLAPKHLGDIVGKVAARNCKRGEALMWEMVE